MSNIITEYSLWWLIPIIISSFLLSSLLYRKDNSFNEIKNFVLIILKSLRFLLVFTLLFLLLKPLLKNTEKTIEKPVIAFLQDNSSSIISNKDSSFIKTTYLKNITKLSEELGQDYKFVLYKFGQNIEKTDSLDFSDNETNINIAIENINKLYSNRNVGAVILASDGIYNKGSNPIYSNYTLEAPIYTITLGDSTIKKDIAIKGIINNDIVFMGNSFPVKVDISSKKLKNKSGKISLLSNDKVISSQKFNIEKDDSNFEINFRINAKEKGLIRYTILIDSLKGEANLENNVKDFVVEVVESKKKVLIIANSPHPDISAITKTLESSLLYKIEYKNINENIEKIQNYDLVILHQLPSKKKNIVDIITKLENLNTPILFILGAQTDIKKFNKLNIGLKINSRINSYEETTSFYNKDFSNFTISKDLVTFSNDLTPLISNFGDFKLTSKNDILFYQKIKNIETQKPLIAFTENAGHKYGFISGEGIWRWRIVDFYKNNSFALFDELIEKTVQFLSVNIKNNPFIVENKTQYKSDENINIIAKLYNKSFELINSPEVQFVLKNSKGDTYNYTFEKYYEFYKLDIGKLPIDDYTFVASTTIGNEKYSKQSMFSVIKSDKEILNTVANFSLLEQLSEKYNGKSYSPNRLNDLIKKIKSNDDISSVAYYQTYLSDLINNIWFFIFLVFLFSLEWFLRKYFGTY